MNHFFVSYGLVPAEVKGSSLPRARPSWPAGLRRCSEADGPTIEIEGPLIERARRHRDQVRHYHTTPPWLANSARRHTLGPVTRSDRSCRRPGRAAAAVRGRHQTGQELNSISCNLLVLVRPSWRRALQFEVRTPTKALPVRPRLDIGLGTPAGSRPIPVCSESMPDFERAGPFAAWQARLRHQKSQY